jgi:hypothetical protein
MTTYQTGGGIVPQSTSAVDPNKCAHHFCKQDTAGNLVCCRCGKIEYKLTKADGYTFWENKNGQS